MVDLAEMKLCPICHYKMEGAGLDKKNNKIIYYRCKSCGLWLTFVL
jgi:transcription elongation factor Elf1